MKLYQGGNQMKKDKFIELKLTGKDHGRTLWLDPDTIASIATCNDSECLLVDMGGGQYSITAADAKRLVGTNTKMFWDGITTK